MHVNFFCFSRFDRRKILELADSVGLMTEFKLFVKGFVDSIKLFKVKLPKRKSEGKDFSMESLISDYLDENDKSAAHNALNDVKMLVKLLENLGVTRNEIIATSESLSAFENRKETKKRIKEISSTMQDIEISAQLRNKISKAGIDRKSLQQACDSGFETLQFLFSETVNQKPRVTANRTLIMKVYDQIVKSK